MLEELRGNAGRKTDPPAVHAEDAEEGGVVVGDIGVNHSGGGCFDEYRTNV